jgi:oxygen-independent coproporphyrinogen-3 oxidase
MAGIYIHIPFCKKRCIYCDFYSTTDNRLCSSYIDTLCKELLTRINEVGKDQIHTIYIGGGTPSQLSIDQLSLLINFIKSSIDFAKIEEFTIEVNPDDVTFEYIKACYSLGINRISMGIQSFVDNELQIINRRHNAKQAEDAVTLIKQAGITNISIDLIYGLPLQTTESWVYSIESAIKLNVPHISCYNLSYEEGTTL